MLKKKTFLVLTFTLAFAFLSMPLYGFAAVGGTDDLDAVGIKAEQLGLSIDGLTLEEAQVMVVDGIESLNRFSEDNSQLFAALMKANSGIKHNKTADLKSAAKMMKGNLSKEYPNITKMSNQKLKKVFLEIFKKHLNINALKLSANEIKAKINTATRKEKESRRLELEKKQNQLNQYAEQTGIDIDGLEFEAAWEKIKQAETDQVWADLNQKATDLGIDIEGTSLREAAKMIKEEMESLNENQDELGTEDLATKAEELGVDISGLTDEEAWAVVNQAEEDMMSEEDVDPVDDIVPDDNVDAGI